MNENKLGLAINIKQVKADVYFLILYLFASFFIGCGDPPLLKNDPHENSVMKFAPQISWGLADAWACINATDTSNFRQRIFYSYLQDASWRALIVEPLDRCDEARLSLISIQYPNKFSCAQYNLANKKFALDSGSLQAHTGSALSENVPYFFDETKKSGLDRVIFVVFYSEDGIVSSIGQVSVVGEKIYLSKMQNPVLAERFKVINQVFASITLVDDHSI